MADLDITSSGLAEASDAFDAAATFPRAPLPDSAVLGSSLVSTALDETLELLRTFVDGLAGDCESLAAGARSIDDTMTDEDSRLARTDAS